MQVTQTVNLRDFLRVLSFESNAMLQAPSPAISGDNYVQRDYLEKEIDKIERIAANFGMEFKVLNMAGRDDQPRCGIDFEIINGDLFLKALRGIPGKYLEDNNFVYNIKFTASRIITKLRGEVDIVNPDERFYELYKILEPLSTEFDRLGLARQALMLKDYQKFAKQGCLREYRAALNSEIFDAEFGPSSWSADMEDSIVDKKWEKALQVLNDMRSNSKAGELFKSVKELLHQHAFKERHIEFLNRVTWPSVS